MSRLPLVYACSMVMGVLCTIPSAFALNDADVREMERICEDRRAEELAPLRERKTQACIEQQMRSPDSCRRYYATYGNRERSPSGAMTVGYYYGLPECQQWLQAREELTRSRSRP